MKNGKNHLLYLLSLPFLFLICAGCIPEVQDNIGTAVFHVSIAGYTEEGDISLSFDLHSPDYEQSINRSVSLDADYSASAYFADLNPGIWDVTVQLLKDESVIGSHTFSFDVFIDETTTNQIEGVYADGEFTFTVFTADPDTETSIRIDNYQVKLLESRRHWDDSKNTPEQYVRIDAEGDTLSMESLTAVFPDNYRFSIGPDTGRALAFSFQQWDDNAGKNGFFLFRYVYLATGTYFISVYDNNNLGDSFTYTVDLDEEGISSPVVSSPVHGSGYNAANPLDITWSFQKSSEIQTTLVFVIEKNNPSNMPYSRVINTTSSPTITIPGGTLAGVTDYNIILVAVNKIIEPTSATPNNELQNFTISSDYDFTDIMEELYSEVDHELEFIGTARMEISTT